MLIRIVLDQEEQLHLLHDENTNQREIIGSIEERFACDIETLLDGPPQLVPIALLHREKERRIKAEQEIQATQKLYSNPQLKPAQKIGLHALRHAVEHGTTHDEEGRTRINATTISKQIGMSRDTGDRLIAFCKTQLPNLADIATHPETLPDGQEVDRTYIKLAPDLLEHPDQIAPLEFRKQGGDKYTCQLCGSKHVKIKRKATRTLICLDCNHSSLIDNTETEEFPNQSFTKEHARNLPHILITSDPPADCAVVDPIPAAAELLLAIAGEHDRHIVMPRHHEKKYLEVKRPLTLDDVTAHLRGGEARGAPCSYADDHTCSLCFDADDIEDWTILEQAARAVAQHGYVPLLEESPAGRGGHLWIIFDAPVYATAAREAVYQIVPELETIAEYWPAPPEAKKWNRVRLPGAYYYRSGKEPVKGWCTLLNAVTGETASDGASVAKLLLASLTPAAVVPALPVIEPEPATEIHSQGEQLEAPTISAGRAAALPNTTSQEPEAPVTQEREAPPIASVAAASFPYTLPNVDAEWEGRYGKIEETRCWFAIMPEVAARWFNERHRLEDIRPRERNNMALSPNGDERTASTGYRDTAQGERWTDFSTHGRRPDGTHEAGDALELASKVWGVPKGTLINEATGEMIKRGSAELESVARAGQPLPPWFEEPECIITPAGRCRYAELLGNAQGQRQTATPAAVQDSVMKLQDDASEARARSEQNGQAPARQVEQPEQLPAAQHHDAPVPQHGSQGEQLQPPAAHDHVQASNTDLQTVMQEHGLTLLGEPCEKCGCPIARDLFGEAVCCRCCPTRGYHEYADLVGQMYPRKQRPLF